MRFIAVVLVALLPFAAVAQDRDSHFADYAAYAAFVDARVVGRDFIPLVQSLGGRDEYTVEQLQALQARLQSIYTTDFDHSAVTRQTDLGNGFRQEMRVYWNDRSGYLYFYAMLHDRPDALVVLNFALNSDLSQIIAKF